MSLLEMSLTGSVMIIAVFLIRCLLLHCLPKKTFVILWGIAAIRLLVPIQITSRWSIYSMMPVTWIETLQNVGNGSFMEENPDGGNAGPGYTGTDYVGMGHTGADDTGTGHITADDTQTVYAGADRTGADHMESGSSGVGRADFDWVAAAGRAGTLLCAGWFLMVYLGSRRKFAESLPVQNLQVERFLVMHKLRRRISVRQFSGIQTPLTYGIWHPVILFPGKTDWTNETELEFMLLHEYVHIRHFDALLKLIVTAVLCIHWFNPLVWLLYIQCNRDIELSCDETVVHISGRQSRDHYAMTLITMAERKSIPAPLSNGFSENTLEERVEAIMLAKRLSIQIGVVAVLLVAAVTVLFATTGERHGTFAGMFPEEQEDQEKQEPKPKKEGGSAGDVSGADEADRGDEADKAGEVTEPEYTIKYFPEGIEEEIPAQPVRGSGYRMLFPVDEELVSNAPEGFTYSHNENAFLRVVVYEGMSREQAEVLLADEGYYEMDNGDYRIQRRNGDVLCAEIVRLAEDVYSTYGLSYGFPDTSEYEENLGACLAATAATFTLDTAGLNADGEALKEAAKGFGDAYLAGDGKTCLEYMSGEADTSCLQELKKGRFDFAGAMAKRLCMGTVEELQDGDEVGVQIECSNPEDGEGNVYLDITFRKETGRLRVVSFFWEM